MNRPTPMRMTRRTWLFIAALLVPVAAWAQPASPATAYSPGDPPRIGATGRLQYVEFYHPL
jgi:hypothetical protein